MKPFATSTCEVNGHQIAYFRAGEGPVVLLVHGITTYSFIWRNIIPFLVKNMQVIAVDLPGCGASGKELTTSYSVKSHAHLIRCFMDQLGIEKFHFAGHDVGGGIGQIFAVNHPDRLIDLSLINSVAYNFWPVQPIIAMRTPIIRQLAMATLDLGAMRLLIRHGLYHKDRLTPELLDYFWTPMKYKQGRKAFLHFAASLNKQDLMEIEQPLRSLELPVLIIRGDSDAYLSETIAEKLASDIPNARLVRIPTGNHYIQEDEPEQVAQALIDFFERNSDGR